MPNALKESHIATGIAKLFYDFLPGTGSQKWKGHVSFQSIARDAGLSNYWNGGSKERAIALLLERTLTYQRSLFENLILTIVREGMKYRQKQDKPISRQEIETLNGLILEVGFKFPALWDPDFLSSLEGNLTERAKERVRETRSQELFGTAQQFRQRTSLSELKECFYSLSLESNRQKAGFDFERLLNALFRLSDLHPRAPFKLCGEQIDGSFSLDSEIYLVQAKWHKDPMPKADLSVFRESVESKSTFTRGVFISVSGISAEAELSFTYGKAANFFVIDGYDISLVLDDRITFPELLRWKLRRLAEEGKIFVSGKELIASQ